MFEDSVKIIHSDPQLVVIDKPGGLLAVPGRGEDKQDCAASRLKKLFPECIEQPAVHRLDMDTSGLMLFALTAEAHRQLSRQFAERLVKKRYVALLDGIVDQKAGEVKLAFRLDLHNRPYQVYDPVHGKIGISRWRRLETEAGKTRVEFVPLTGRTHQLRLHAAHRLGLDCPIVGDRLYGNGTQPGQMKLHASFLWFRHPASGQEMVFHSVPPF